MKKIISSLSLIALCSINSCTSSNDEIKKPVDELTIASRLKFVNVNDRIANLKDSKVKMVVFTFEEFGRTSRECHGFGLCHFVWNLKGAEPIANGEKATLLELNETANKYYVDFLLAAPVPSDMAVEEIPLKVDEDILINIQQEIGENLKVKQNSYAFNASLGDYGGYRIYLD